MTLNEYGGSFWGDENVVTLDVGDGFINFASMLKKKPTKLYNFKRGRFSSKCIISQF